jgi:hypothetical protein
MHVGVAEDAPKASAISAPRNPRATVAARRSPLPRGTMDVSFLA